VESLLLAHRRAVVHQVWLQRTLGVLVKSGPFKYHRPESVGDTSKLLGEFGDNAKILAGGQSLVPMMAMRLVQTDNVIDINDVAEIQGVERLDDVLRIGAGTRQAAVEHDAVAGAAIPLLAQALPLIGHFQIRNRGTIGGSIAHADPASELPAVAVALDAQLQITARTGSRTVAAADFFEGLWTTALSPDEILTHVDFPIWGDRAGFALEEAARRSGDFALVGAVVAVGLDGGDAVERAAISLFGLGTTPISATAAELALVGTSVDDIDFADVASAALDGVDVREDVHASSRYRRKVATALVMKALTRALEDARG
jgi:carbon-monoxide dehydrogenase medium subunit